MNPNQTLLRRMREVDAAVEIATGIRWRRRGLLAAYSGLWPEVRL